MDKSTSMELWLDPSCTWKRDQQTGVFDIVTFNGKPLHPALRRADVAAMLGCPSSTDRLDCGEDERVWFPSNFKYSPVTGIVLESAVETNEAWLPPFGSQGLPNGVLRGARLTNAPLRISESSFEADFELPVPQQGEFKFCVGAFKTSSSCLLALEPAQGLIFCFLHSTKQWVELVAAEGSSALSTFTGASEAWGVGSTSLITDDRLFWPSDRGLLEVKVQLASMTYESNIVVQGRCLTAPSLSSTEVFALVEQGDAIAVMKASTGSSKEENASFQMIGLAKTNSGSDWQSPYATSREIFWLSELGHFVIRPGVAEFIKWPTFAVPRFELGSIHASSDGKLWQVCEQPADGEESRITYIQVGRPKPEMRPSSGPRTLTGMSSLKLESWLPGDPWIEPDIADTGDHSQDETVISLVESVASRTLLCFRVPNTGNLVDFFSKTGELLTTTFQIMDQHDENGFYKKRMDSPWKTRPFVFGGALYLYHPSMDTLPGWKLSSAK